MKYLKEINALDFKINELTNYINWVKSNKMETNFDRFTFECINTLKDKFKKDLLVVLNQDLNQMKNEISSYKIEKL